MFQKLSNPYPCETSTWKRLLQAIWFGAFVFLFLWIFRPFGIDRAGQHLPIIALGYGLCCTAVMSLLNVVLPQVFPGYFSEERWTLGRELSWSVANIAGIGMINALYSAAVGFGAFNLSHLIRFELYTLAVGVFPVGLGIVLNQRRLQSRYERESKQITGWLNPSGASPDETTPESNRLVLHAENGKDQLELGRDTLLYLKAADNYVEIYFLDRGSVQRHLLRNSLKNIVHAIRQYTEFHRCHKSYLVNLNKVSAVSGNAQGLRLHLEGGPAKIPVSRAQHNEIRSRLQQSA